MIAARLKLRTADLSRSTALRYDSGDNDGRLEQTSLIPPRHHNSAHDDRRNVAQWSVTRCIHVSRQGIMLIVSWCFRLKTMRRTHCLTVAVIVTLIPICAVVYIVLISRLQRIIALAQAPPETDSLSTQCQCTKSIVSSAIPARWYECDVFELENTAAPYLIPVSTAPAPDRAVDSVYSGGQSMFHHYRRIAESLQAGRTSSYNSTLYANVLLTAEDIAYETALLDQRTYVTSRRGAVLTPFSAQCPRFISVRINVHGGLSHRSFNIQKAYSFAFAYNLTIVYQQVETGWSIHGSNYDEADTYLTYGLGELHQHQWAAMMEWSRQFPHQLNLSVLLQRVTFHEWINGKARHDCYVYIDLHEEGTRADYPLWTYAHNQRKVSIGWRALWRRNSHWMDAHVNRVINAASSYRRLLSSNSSYDPILIGIHIRGGDRPQNPRWYLHTLNSLIAVFVIANVPFHFFLASDDVSFATKIVEMFEEYRNITITPSSSPQWRVPFYTLLLGEDNPLDLITTFARMNMIVTGADSGFSAMLTTGFHHPDNRILISPGSADSPSLAPTIVSQQFVSETLLCPCDQLRLRHIAQSNIDAWRARVPVTSSPLLVETCRTLP